LRDKKKSLKPKRKNLFDLRFFTYREEKRRRRERNQERKNKERAIHPPANSNLPGESIARERERVLLFINRGKAPLFYKK